MTPEEAQSLGMVELTRRAQERAENAPAGVTDPLAWGYKMTRSEMHEALGNDKWAETYRADADKLVPRSA